MKIDEMHSYLTDYYRNRRKSKKVKQVQSIVKQTTKKKIIQVQEVSPLSDFQRLQKHMNYEQQIYTRVLPRGLKVHFQCPPEEPPKLQKIPYTYQTVPPRPFKMPKRRPGQIKDWVIEESRFADRGSFSQKKNKSVIENYKRTDRDQSKGKIIIQQDKRNRFRHSVKKLVQKMRQKNLTLKEIIKNKGLYKQPYNYLNSIDFFQMCRSGDLGIQSLLSNQPQLAFDIDEQQMTGLHWAAREGHVNLCRILIQKHRASYHSKDIYGRTPLHLAVENKNIECIIRLFIQGANLHAMNKEKKTVRMVANDAYIRYLLEKLQQIKFAENAKTQIEKQMKKQDKNKTAGYMEMNKISDLLKQEQKRNLQKAIRTTLDQSSLYF